MNAIPTREVARMLGLAPSAVRALARRRGLGSMEAGRLVFTLHEIEILRVRRGGPPTLREAGQGWVQP